ncbi:MAG: hypothetical protein PF636_03530 [Actinomycetota bacterium]|jgi:vacuolar-type H+-ATPase subunit H|nr:hypothetical protein [Actinomycetota bacterium]
MEKLEEIFQAEEAARRAVDAARDRAREIRAKAVAESEAIVQAAARESSVEGSEQRTEILQEADSARSAADHDADAALGDVISRAETRMGIAADAVVSELVR